MSMNFEHLPMTAIRSFCERWKVTELSLFGSALREDFSDSSDVDILVTFAENAN